MPKFYTDSYDGRSAMADRFGIEADSAEEAADEAAALLPDFAREIVLDGQAHDFAVALRNEKGVVIYRAVMLFRAQWPERTWNDSSVSIRDVHFNIAESQALRQEVKILRQQLCEGLDSLVETMEAARASLQT